MDAYSLTQMNGSSSEKKYKGVRRRKWGKWVSEIRVPGSQERLWLGSYSNPEAAAVAHDVASYCLRGVSAPNSLNFPLRLPASARYGLSPKSVQRAASDAGMAIDAQMIVDQAPAQGAGTSDTWNTAADLGHYYSYQEYMCPRTENLNISVDDYMWPV